MNEIPTQVKKHEMRREWWVLYEWIPVTEYQSDGILYLRGVERQIEDSTSAGRQFDEMWNAYQSVKGEK